MCQCVPVVGNDIFFSFLRFGGFGLLFFTFFFFFFNWENTGESVYGQLWNQKLSLLKPLFSSQFNLHFFHVVFSLSHSLLSPL
jgi:hypothetical protein